MRNINESVTSNFIKEEILGNKLLKYIGVYDLNTYYRKVDYLNINTYLTHAMKPMNIYDYVRLAIAKLYVSYSNLLKDDIVQDLYIRQKNTATRIKKGLGLKTNYVSKIETALYSGKKFEKSVLGVEALQRKYVKEINENFQYLVRTLNRFIDVGDREILPTMFRKELSPLLDVSDDDIELVATGRYRKLDTYERGECQWRLTREVGQRKTILISELKGHIAIVYLHYNNMSPGHTCDILCIPSGVSPEEIRGFNKLEEYVDNIGDNMSYIKVKDDVEIPVLERGYLEKITECIRTFAMNLQGNWTYFINSKSSAENIIKPYHLDSGKLYKVDISGLDIKGKGMDISKMLNYMDLTDGNIRNLHTRVQPEHDLNLYKSTEYLKQVISHITEDIKGKPEQDQDIKGAIGKNIDMVKSLGHLVMIAFGYIGNDIHTQDFNKIVKYARRKRIALTQLLPLLLEFTDVMNAYNAIDDVKMDSSAKGVYMRKFNWFSEEFQRLYNKLQKK